MVQEARVIDEETVCRPETFDGDPGPAYGIVKLATERLCLLYWKWNGLPVTAFRIDLVFSDDEELLVSKDMVSKVQSGRVKAVGGEGSSAIHVDDVVEAFLLATQKKRSYGQVFNLSNPATFMSDGELYAYLAQVVGVKSKFSTVNGKRGKGPVFSVKRARRSLGWKPQRGKEDRKSAIAKSVLSA